MCFRIPRNEHSSILHGQEYPLLYHILKFHKHISFKDKWNLKVFRSSDKVYAWTGQHKMHSSLSQFDLLKKYDELNQTCAIKRGSISPSICLRTRAPVDSIASTGIARKAKGISMVT